MEKREKRTVEGSQVLKEERPCKKIFKAVWKKGKKVLPHKGREDEEGTPGKNSSRPHPQEKVKRGGKRLLREAKREEKNKCRSWEAAAIYLKCTGKTGMRANLSITRWGEMGKGGGWGGGGIYPEEKQRIRRM